MYIKKIEILNFRNIDHLILDFNKRVNIFIGKNAQGKTSILESIYTLAFTKSCKGFSEDELIKMNKDFFRVRGELKTGSYKKRMEISYKKNKKLLKINDYKITKNSDYISILNIIMFSPDDLDIVKKSPINRRNFLNIELCQLYNKYLSTLNEYNKVLKMRNEYIRKNYNSINYNYLDIITDKLIDRAIVICKYRNDFINDINEYINDVFYKITKKRGLKIVYKNSFDSLLIDDIKEIYRANYSSDIEKGSTSYGPHRDDIEFFLDNNDLKLYGSQGLQRLAILSFKFSEINIFKREKGTYPIILLDDIFSEIDLDKRKNILKFIKNNIQFIITTTDINNISDKILSLSTIFEIKNGIVNKRSDK